MVLSPEALSFVEKLHRQFQPTRQALLKTRAERQAEFDIASKEFVEFLTFSAYRYLD